MSKQAEEAALKAYPDYPTMDGGYVTQRKQRKVFIQGYEAAEKDLALTWEDMRKIIRIYEEMMGDPEAHPEWMEEQPFYEEILKRYLEAKK